MRTSWICGVALIAACGAADDDAEGTVEEDVPARGMLPTPRPGVAMEEPIARVVLENGNELHFYGALGEGTAILELGHVSHGGSVMARPELRDASPAEVFWAVSAPGTKVPALLARAPSFDGRAQGWFARENKQLMSTPVQCMTDGAFDITFCDMIPPYDDHKCFFNRTGTTVWSSGRASRYKTGLCVQSGTVRDTLSHDYFNPVGACNTRFEGPVTWDGDVGAGGWLSWTWIGGAGDLWRQYTHSTTEALGDVYDHGQRWNNEPNCL